MATTNCPRCTRVFNEKHGALSRLDNETKICSPCGQSEAMWMAQLRGKPLPPFGKMANWFTESN